MCNSTHNIIGCATLTRQDHTVAQTRELAYTRAVIPEVINRGDFYDVLILVISLMIIGLIINKLFNPKRSSAPLPVGGDLGVTKMADIRFEEIY